MLSVPVTFNNHGTLVKGDVILSDAASPEQVEAFQEIQRLSEVNKMAWQVMKNNTGWHDNGKKDLTKGILI